MSFDIARTPTLHAVATGDEQQLVEDLQERAEAAVRQAEEAPAVMEAAKAQYNAEQYLARLQLAERALDPRLKQAERGDLYKQIWRMNAEKAYVVPICFNEHYWVVNPKLGGAERILNTAAVQGALTDWRYVYMEQ